MLIHTFAVRGRGVARLLGWKMILQFILEYILEKNHLNVTSVINHLGKVHIAQDTRSFTLGINPMYVIAAGKDSYKYATWKFTRQFVVESNLTEASEIPLCSKKKRLLVLKFPNKQKVCTYIWTKIRCKKWLRYLSNLGKEMDNVKKKTFFDQSVLMKALMPLYSTTALYHCTLLLHSTTVLHYISKL